MDQMITSFLPLLDKGYSGYVVAFMFLILNITQLLTAYQKSRGTLYTKVVDGAIERQDRLDQKQNVITDDLKAEVVDVRKEVRHLLTVIKDDQERYQVLVRQYMDVLKEKSDLMETVGDLRNQNKELLRRLELVEKELTKPPEENQRE